MTIFERSIHVCDNQVNRTVQVLHDTVVCVIGVQNPAIPEDMRVNSLAAYMGQLYTHIVFCKLLGIRKEVMDKMRSYCQNTYEYLEMAIPRLDDIYDREMSREMAGPVDDLADANMYMVEKMAVWKKGHPEH